MSNRVFRVLLVEPETVLAEVTRFRLELLGYVVDHVATGEEALVAVEQQTPDVVVCDLTLPQLTGMELIERLASSPDTCHIPIMVISFEAEIESVQEAHKTGASDYLVAPYHPVTLEEKIGRLVERNLEAQASAASPN